MSIPLLLRKVLFFSLLFGALQAQIVNIEQLRFKTDTSLWLFQDNLSFSVFRNTDQVVDIENDFLLRYYRGKNQLLLLNSLHFNFSEDINFAQAGFIHLRYVRSLSNLTELEAFGQVQTDRPLRIEQRALFGIGPRFGVDQKGSFQFHTGHLLMYESDKEMFNDIQHYDWRLSSYVSLLWKYKEKFNWTLVSYYQPRFEDWSDWRLSLQNQLSFKLGEHWAFTVSASLNYDAQPVVDPNIPNLTYKLDNGILVKF